MTFLGDGGARERGGAGVHYDKKLTLNEMFVVSSFLWNVSTDSLSHNGIKSWYRRNKGQLIINDCNRKSQTAGILVYTAYIYIKLRSDEIKTME